MMERWGFEWKNMGHINWVFGPAPAHRRETLRQKKRKEKKRAEENEKDWKMTREESEGLRNFDERRGEGAGSENMGG